MSGTRYLLVLTLIGALPAGLAGQETPSAEESRKQKRRLEQEIAERREALDRLREDRERLEGSITNRERLIRRIDRQHSIYRSNLERSQAEAQELEGQLTAIRARLSVDRAFMLAGVEAANPRPDEPRALGEQRRTAAVTIVLRKLTETAAKRDEARKLGQRLDSERAYQDRIISRYMPNEAVHKGRMETSQTRDATQLEQQTGEEIVVTAELRKLEARARALDAALSQLQAQSTRKSQQPSEGQVLRRAPFRPGVAFAKLKGRLPPPVAGNVVRAFGPYTHPTAGVTIDSHGLDIEVTGAAKVSAVADGRVLFTGFVPEYGDIIALEHGDGYVTVYGNVIAGALSEGQVVRAGEPIGAVEETNGRLILHFEIRKDNTAINPQPWLGS